MIFFFYFFFTNSNSLSVILKLHWWKKVLAVIISVPYCEVKYHNTLSLYQYMKAPKHPANTGKVVRQSQHCGFFSLVVISTVLPWQLSAIIRWDKERRTWPCASGGGWRLARPQHAWATVAGDSGKIMSRDVLHKTPVWQDVTDVVLER